MSATPEFTEAEREQYEIGMMLMSKYKIGTHTPKLPKLVDTIRRLPDYSRPYQIFLGGPQNTRMRMDEEELVITKRLVEHSGAKVFVHSQYIINLCGDNDWATELLIKNLQSGVMAGFKGVVVHVGKSVKMSVTEAMNRMRENVRKALEYATEDCPLLLETPAGQGTETLTDVDDFINFVEEFDDPRLRVCVDTCHTFACGHCPMTYINKFTEAPIDSKRHKLLKLIHFNDSKVPCGSRKDRHAFIGTGHIGLETMNHIAKHCDEYSLPMVVE